MAHTFTSQLGRCGGGAGVSHPRGSRARDRREPTGIADARRPGAPVGAHGPARQAKMGKNGVCKLSPGH
jgi:hypothetical protein